MPRSISCSVSLRFGSFVLLADHRCPSGHLFWLEVAGYASAMRVVLGTILAVGGLVAACGGSSSSNGKNDARELTSAGGVGSAGAPATGGSAAQSGGQVGSIAGNAPHAGTGGADGPRGGASHAGTTSHDAGAPGDVDRAGDGGTTTTDGGASSAGNMGEGGEGGAGFEPPKIECHCAVDQACIRVRVRRAADDSRMPWVVWPEQADGSGSLRVSAVSDAYVIQDKVSLPRVDLTLANATYGVPLCVPAGSTHVRAFLDDNEDELPNAVTSSDYLDSCASGSAACPRCFSMSVTSGAQADLSIELAHSCD